ncbi:MAG TPA: twin-arginine translocase subunit TatC [Verrucomicrobiae bacterium]|nr:twin-arginine translocase subunit TatC [Verrucomicrobiae bacterium]
MKTKKKSRNHNQRAAPPRKKEVRGSTVLPFIEHAQELRRRLYYIAGSVVLWGCAIYSVQQHVVAALLRPSKGQHFIYTSPGGGIDFLFRICVYGGLVLSLPVIVYNTLRFIEPLLARQSRRFVVFGSLAASVLAALGVVFGYYVGLPAALHFLLHQFTTVQIQPLVTIQAYLGFVIVYMFGSAMLFQLPLLLLFINRIKPLKPKRLLHYERWVILVAFVLAGLMNPTPNIISQLLVAGPFIIAYQVAIVLIACINQSRKTTAAQLLREQDAAAQASRLARLPNLQPVPLLGVPPLAAAANIGSQTAHETLRQSTRLPQASSLEGVNPAALPALRSRRQIYALRSQSRSFEDIRTGLGRPGMRPANNNFA